MAGKGYINDAEKIDANRIKILRNGQWQPMVRPINPDGEFSGVSLAESFAEQYSKKYNVDVGLICCAVGGTRIDQWAVGEPLYDNAIFQAKLAMRTSALAGVLWHQGEADCFNGLHETYCDKLKKLITSVRKDIGIKDLPFVLGGLGESLKNTKLEEYKKYSEYVCECIKSVAASDELIGFASAEGLGSNPDNIHFNSKALYEFGIRYFNEFEKLRKRDNLFDDTLYYEDSKRSYLESL